LSTVRRGECGPVPTPAGPALVRIRFEDPRRAPKRPAAHRVIIDIALPALCRVWGEAVLEGRAGSAGLLSLKVEPVVGPGETGVEARGILR